MARFLLDENISKPLAKALCERGHEAHRAQEIGLNGKSDEEIFAYAIKNDCILITCDRGFGNPKRHALSQPHRGVIIAQFPSELPYPIADQEVLKVIDAIDLPSLERSLIIIRAGQFRRKTM